MKDTIRASLPYEQFGYRPGKGTRNAILCLKILAEKCIEKHKDLYICFIDYVKAFDYVKHDELMTMLEELEIDRKDQRRIRNLHWDQKAAIKTSWRIGETGLTFRKAFDRVASCPRTCSTCSVRGL